MNKEEKWIIFRTARLGDRAFFEELIQDISIKWFMVGFISCLIVGFIIIAVSAIII